MGVKVDTLFASSLKFLFQMRTVINSPLLSSFLLSLGSHLLQQEIRFFISKSFYHSGQFGGYGGGQPSLK
jgi:hypothetical protein